MTTRTVKDVLNDYRDSDAYERLGIVDWGELESRLNHYIETVVKPQVLAIQGQARDVESTTEGKA